MVKISRSDKRQRRNMERRARRYPNEAATNSLQKNFIPATPKTPTQKVYAKLLRSKDQVFSVGPAGTGKTYLAADAAIEGLLSGRFKSIILTRPLVTVEDEQSGFLPGDLNKKIAPWVAPFEDAYEKARGLGTFQMAIKNGLVKVVPLGYMRGRTFDDAFVMLDEAQNTTLTQMKMFLTRIGENSVVVVNGDITQTDLKGTDKTGLEVAVELIRSKKLEVPVVVFSEKDIVRSATCAMWAEAFEEV